MRRTLYCPFGHWPAGVLAFRCQVIYCARCARLGMTTELRERDGWPGWVDTPELWRLRLASWPHPHSEETMPDNPDTTDLLTAIDRLADSGALELAIAATRRRLKLLSALRDALKPAGGGAGSCGRPGEANGGNGHARKPFRSPGDKGRRGDRPPDGCQGETELLVNRRLAAARYLAENGPQRAMDLAAGIGVRNTKLYRVVNDCPWFESSAGRWELTALGRQEAIAPKEG